MNIIFNKIKQLFCLLIIMLFFGVIQSYAEDPELKTTGKKENSNQLQI